MIFIKKQQMQNPSTSSAANFAGVTTGHRAIGHSTSGREIMGVTMAGFFRQNRLHALALSSVLLGLSVVSGPSSLMAQTKPAAPAPMAPPAVTRGAAPPADGQAIAPVAPVGLVLPGTGVSNPDASATTSAVAVERMFWSGASASLDLDQEQRELARMEPPRPTSTSAAGDLFTYNANFQDDLFMQTDLVLPGVQSVQTITFPKPRQWKLLEGSEIVLHLEHSSPLIPERSHITVSLNDVAIKSIRLDASNVTEGEIRLPLPVYLLQDYNKIKLEVQQHYTFECEDPFDPALWTKVGRGSTIRFNYQYRPVTTDLSQYPLPFFDRLGYGYTVVRYVMPQRASSQTLQALGLVSAGLGREISYGHAAIAEPLQSLDAARGHTILVGTPQENPEVSRLIGSQLGNLGPGDGYLAIVPHPTNPTIAVLVVTGGGPDGVLKAASALSSPRRNFLTSGSYAVIKTSELDEASKLREREGFVPNNASFTLDDLGFKDSTVKGFFAGPIRVDVRSLPDMQFFERLQNLKLYYSYGAQLDTRLSTLEVRWNNITVQSVALDNPEGETRAKLDINIPADIITPYNTLQFVFHLLPRSYNPCETKVDHQLWGTIFRDSEFEMPHYDYAEMPDLSKLQYGLYPFGLYEDLSDTLLVVPDNPDANDLSAASTIALELGRNIGARRVALRLVQGQDVTPELRDSKHMIIVHSGRQNSILEAMNPHRVVNTAASGKTLTGEKGRLLELGDVNTLGILEQFISPYGKERAVVVVQGLTLETLKRSIRMMVDIRLASQLTGDVAVMSLDNKVESNRIRATSAFGSIPLLVSIRDLGRNHPWLVVGLLLGALFLLFLVLKGLLSLYRQRHHGPDEPEDNGPKSGGPTPPPSAGPSSAELRGAATSERVTVSDSGVRVGASIPAAPAAPPVAPRSAAPRAAAPPQVTSEGWEALESLPPEVPEAARPAGRRLTTPPVDPAATRRRPRPGQRSDGSDDSDGNA